MQGPLGGFISLPAPLKAVILVAGGGSILTAAGWLLPAKIMWCIIIGLALIGLVMGLYVWLGKRSNKRKAEPFEREITGNISSVPQGLSDPNSIASHDDVKRKFLDAVNEFRRAGKNLYTVPWYLIVGESGAGKTEAIRHSDISFVTGLTDQYQGAGGTVNMDWWFTSDGVILDTAGRMFFENADEGGSKLWKSFLALMKKYRRHAPINGLILAIPADTIRVDDADTIKRKAAHIARQMDTIQRMLDVRFPVYVLVTKCDLIHGFREFFENLDDRLRNQVFGWSNRGDLDEPFDPSQTPEIIAEVVQKLNRRRLRLMDTVAMGGGSGAADRIDNLYTFPDAIIALSEKLKLYMEAIFAQSSGPFSLKPLFIRGIYFTAAMQQGKALDVELARMLNVNPKELPENRRWETNRCFFLHDLFMEKVFKEGGLVTSATNARKEHARHRAIFAAAGTGVAVIVFLLSWLGIYSFQHSIGKETQLWQMAVPREPSDDPEAESICLSKLIEPGNRQMTWFKYIYRPIEGDSRTLPEFHRELRELATQPLRIPWIFRFAAVFSEDIDSRRRKAQEVLFERRVLLPAVQAARRRMTLDSAWDQNATRALGSLIGLEVDHHYRTKGLVKSARTDQPRPFLDDLVRAINLDDQQLTEYEKKADVLEQVRAGIYDGPSGRAWPPESFGCGGRLTQDGIPLGSQDTIEAGVARVAAWWQTVSEQEKESIEQIRRLADGLQKKYDAIELKMLLAAGQAIGPEEWADMFGQLAVEYRSVSERIRKLGAQSLGGMLESLRSSICRQAHEDILGRVMPYLGTALDAGLIPGEDAPELAKAYVALHSALIKQEEPEFLAKVSRDLLGAMIARLEKSLSVEGIDLAELDDTYLAIARDPNGKIAAFRERLQKEAEGDALLAKLVEEYALLAMLQQEPRACEIRFCMYALAQAVFADFAEAEGFDCQAVDGSISSIRKRSATCKSLIAQLEEAAPETAGVLEARKLASAVAELGARHSIQSSLVGMIKAAAGKIPGPDIDPAAAFSPETARPLFTLHVCLSKILQSKEMDIGDRGALDEEFERLTSKLGVYQESYELYWKQWLANLEGMPVVEKDRQEEWASYRQFFADLRYFTIERSIQKVADRILEVLAVVPGENPGVGAVKADLEAIASQDYKTACKSLLEKWAEVAGRGPLEARALLLDKQLNMRNFRPPAVGATDDPYYSNYHFIDRYWERLIGDALGALSKAADEAAALELAEFKKKYDRFPVNWAADSPLGANSLGDVRRSIALLVDVDFEDDRDWRHSIGKLKWPDTSDGILVKRVAALLDSLPPAGETFTCTAQKLDPARPTEEFYDSMTLDYDRSMLGKWRLRTEDKGFIDDRGRPTVPEFKYPHDIKDLFISFYEHPTDKDPDRVTCPADKAGGWGILWLLKSSDVISAEPITDDRTDWQVRFKITDNAGNKREATLHLKYERGLPSTKDWPRW